VDFNGETVSAGAVGLESWHADDRRSGSGARDVLAVREIHAISHRLLGWACIAQTRPRWPVPCPRFVVVVVMEARSVPIDTPAAEYRPWRLPLSSSRVTRPEVKASRQVASRSPAQDRPR